MREVARKWQVDMGIRELQKMWERLLLLSCIALSL
jgi:hypothetical protein